MTGANDGEESNDGTDPNNSDTDGDGTPDGADDFQVDQTKIPILITTGLETMKTKTMTTMEFQMKMKFVMAPTHSIEILMMTE